MTRRHAARFAALLLVVPSGVAVARLPAQPAGSVEATAARVRAETDAWRRAHEGTVLRRATSLFAMPNVASDSVAIRALAAELARRFGARGFETALLESPAGGPPAVFAERRTPGATRTVMLYAHYDGQPVSGAPWLGDPWTPTLRAREGGAIVPLPADGDTLDHALRLYARSASDDKGPIVAVLAALDAMAANGTAPDVHLKVFLEGEEEAGSAHLGPLLRAHADRLAADAWLFLDGPLHVSGAAQVVLGVRGIVSADITLFGPDRPLHSGHYGNWAPNPAARLAHLVAAMRDPQGAITIPGFLDDVRAPTPAERAAARALSATDDSVRATLGLAGAERLEPTLGEAIMRPALNVRGLRSGAVGGSARNAVPTSASVSIDFRLVPDQRPERVQEIVNAFLAARGYTVLPDIDAVAGRADRDRIAVARWSTGYRSVRAGVDALPVAALRRVLTAAHGEPPLLAPTLGGSLPLFHFADTFDVPLVILPTVNADNNQHAPNENLRIGALWNAIGTFAATLATFGRAWDEAAPVVP